MGFPVTLLNTFINSEEDKIMFKRKIVPSFFMEGFSGVFVLFTTLLLTRLLDANGYGILVWAFACSSLIVNFSTGGLNQLVVREISSLLSQGKKGLHKGFYNWSIRIVVYSGIGAAFIASVVLFLMIYQFHFFKETPYTLPALLAFISIPFMCLAGYFGYVLRGNHQTVLSLVSPNIVKPVFYLVFIVVAVYLSGQLGVKTVVLLNTSSFVLACIAAYLIFKKTVPMQDVDAEYDLKRWRTSLGSFFLLTGFMGFNSYIGVIMLRILKDPSQVGIFNAADRIAATLVSILYLMNTITAASVSRLNALNEKAALQKMITKIIRFVVALSLPVYLLLVILSKWLLHFCGNGTDFLPGQAALIIISSAQLLNIAFGPVGNLAVMTGNEKYNTIFYIGCILINITLNLLLIPFMGLNGTAIASATSIVFWNAGMYITIRKKTGINTWIFAI